jgi:hypothetical protein
MCELSFVTCSALDVFDLKVAAARPATEPNVVTTSKSVSDLSL